MSKKVSVAPLKFTKTVKARQIGKSEERRQELAANAMADKPLRKALSRVRVRGPLTPRAIRIEMISAIAEFSDEIRESVLRTRLTELDRFLDDDEAYALEKFAADEEDFGRMKTGQTAERVSSSTRNHDVGSGRLEALKLHARIKSMLDPRDRRILGIWVRQMSGDKQAPSHEIAGIATGHIPTSDPNAPLSRKEARAAAQHWFGKLKKTGQRLFALYENSGRRSGQAGRATPLHRTPLATCDMLNGQPSGHSVLIDGRKDVNGRVQP